MHKFSTYQDVCAHGEYMANLKIIDVSTITANCNVKDAINQKNKIKGKTKMKNNNQHKKINKYGKTQWNIMCIKLDMLHSFYSSLETVAVSLNTYFQHKIKLLPMITKRF